MSLDDHITVRGFVATEPRLWGTPESPASMCTSMRVGSTPRWLNRTTGEWQEGPASFYTVKCWRRMALNAKTSLRKGDLVFVRGKVRTRVWMDGDQKRTEMVVEADSIGHDLAYGTSIFTKTTQVSPLTARDVADGEQARQDIDPDPDALGRDHSESPGTDPGTGSWAAGWASSGSDVPAIPADAEVPPGADDQESRENPADTSLTREFAGVEELATPF